MFPFLSFSQYDGNTTPNYPQLIAQYQLWDKQHDEIQLYNMGKSDTEYPLYVCLINAGKDSAQAFENARKGTTILINNAIHPGEPDGVNACLIWIRDWIKAGKKVKDLPVIAIIPAYNVGGMFNRSGTSRANQDGPVEYGFRGNAQNLDLNRDFIKMDSENAKTFASIYQALDPDVFVDNHVSNGADYQYTLTLITSLKERLEPDIRTITYNKLLPDLTVSLKKRKWDWIPYVDTKSEIPDSGIVAFNDLPRYAMGYASLFHSISFTVETHMLKPFPQRVQATLAFMEELVKWTNTNKGLIETARKNALESNLKKNYYLFNYRETGKSETIPFKGFEASHPVSEVTGLPRLYYDRNKPKTMQIPYYNSYASTDSILIPEGYVISGEAINLIEKLKLNGVEMVKLESMRLETTSIRIQNYKSASRPYEGHFLHNSTEIKEQLDTIRIPSGSVYIPTDQARRKFIVSVLEPQTEDSYFAWNFMDSYIQEKEYFSAYVFEDKAKQILEANPELKSAFLKKKSEDAEFAKNADAQLFYIYQHSENFERRTFNRLPVFKMYKK